MNALAERKFERMARGRELTIVGLVLLIANVPLILTRDNPLAFRADAVAEGEWWRIITHPFTHVSGYHFLLDGVAFLTLWTAVRGSVLRRIALTAASAVGALGLSLVISAAIWQVGLCGLSGVAHGFMIVVALDGMRQSSDRGLRAVSVVTLLGVLAKIAFELGTGTLAMGFMHQGQLGVPIVECHAGGVLGAVMFVGMSMRQHLHRLTIGPVTRPKLRIQHQRRGKSDLLSPIHNKNCPSKPLVIDRACGFAPKRPLRHATLPPLPSCTRVRA
jgi:rhomboid family GlyGly-CTERM serine protease